MKIVVFKNNEHQATFETMQGAAKHLLTNKIKLSSFVRANNDDRTNISRRFFACNWLLGEVVAIGYEAAKKKGLALQPLATNKLEVEKKPKEVKLKEPDQRKKRPIAVFRDGMHIWNAPSMYDVPKQYGTSYVAVWRCLNRGCLAFLPKQKSIAIIDLQQAIAERMVDHHQAGWRKEV
jgi:hypothetical protein